jgi:hypothetical protein
MSVLSQFFLAFMGGNLSKFAFSSAGHLTLLGYGIKTAQAVLSVCNKGKKRSRAEEKGIGSRE